MSSSRSSKSRKNDLGDILANLAFGERVAISFLAMEFASGKNRIYSNYENNIINSALTIVDGEISVKLTVLLCPVCHSVKHPPQTQCVICPIKHTQLARMAKSSCSLCIHKIYEGDSIAPYHSVFCHRDCVLAVELPALKRPLRCLTRWMG